MNLFKLSNRILDLKLTASELTVFAYLCSIRASKMLIGDMVKVRQSVIAEKCGIKTSATVSRIIRSLQEKGFIDMIIPTEKANRMRSTNSYIIKKLSHSDGFFYVQKNIFCGRLNPRQIRVYLFIARSYSHKLGYCWNSYNDIAKQLGMKRTDVINTIKELTHSKFIRKICRHSHENKRVFVDNIYIIVMHGKNVIRKNCQKKLGCPFP